MYISVKGNKNTCTITETLISTSGLCQFSTYITINCVVTKNAKCFTLCYIYTVVFFIYNCRNDFVYLRFARVIYDKTLKSFPIFIIMFNKYALIFYILLWYFKLKKNVMYIFKTYS